MRAYTIHGFRELWRLPLVLVACLAVAGCKESELEQPVSLPPARTEDTPAPSASDSVRAEMPSPKYEGIPEVVATIGDDIKITRAEYEAELDRTWRMYQSQLLALGQMSNLTPKEVELKPERRRDVLHQLVQERIYGMLAEREGIAATEEEIDARVAQGIENLRDDQSYADYLRWYQMTPEQLREQLRRTVTREKFIAAKSPECPVTDEQVAKEYERQKAAGNVYGPDIVHMRHILVSIPPRSDDATVEAGRAELLVAKARIQAGEDFEKVAVEVSDDPNVKRDKGTIKDLPRNVMASEVEKVLFEGPIGEWSDPIRTSYGWDLVIVDRRWEEGIRSLDDLREILRQLLETQCKQAALGAILKEAFREFKVKIPYDPTKV